MILKTLTLQNFRKFKHTSIEFPEGIIGVVGFNGSGKSTIFEAIAWALYGTVAARTSSEDIKRNAAEPSSACIVDLCFQFEGDEYRVVRQMKGKAFISSATITRNGKIAATGAGSSTMFIQKTLGMDYKSFFTSIFARQKELNTLSSMNASERRPLILKMLGIDSLDEVIKQINADKRNKSSLISHLERNIFDKNGCEKQKILLNKQKILKEQQQQSNEEIKEMKKKLKKLKDEQKTTNIDVKYAKRKYEDINKKHEIAIKEKTLYEQNQKIIQEISHIKHKIEKRIKNIQLLKKELINFENIDQEIIKTNKRMEEINNSTSEIIKQKTQEESELDHLMKQKKEIIKKQNSISKLGLDATCPTCERELGDQFEFLLEKYGTKHDELENECVLLEQKLQETNEQQEQKQREHKALQKKKEFYRKKEKEQQEVKTRIESHKKEQLLEEKELKEKEQLLNKNPSIEFNLNLFQIIENQRKTLYQRYQQLIKKTSKVKDNLSKQTLSIEKKQSNIALLIQEINSIKKQRNELKEMHDKIKNEQQKIVEISMLKEIMVSFRLHLVSRIRPALSQYASSFFHDLTDGKYAEMTLDDQYNINIYDDGKKYPIQRFSGGEIDLANLCLRLAISDVITERAEGLFHFIILDEIFGSQDRLRQQNIMQELYKLSSTFKQIFLITHVEEIKHYLQHIIQVEETNDESIIIIN